MKLPTDEDFEIIGEIEQIKPIAVGSNDYIRAIDETGEDNPYPAKYFVPIQLPPEVARILPVGSALRNGGLR